MADEKSPGGENFWLSNRPAANQGAGAQEQRAQQAPAGGQRPEGESSRRSGGARHSQQPGGQQSAASQQSAQAGQQQPAPQQPAQGGGQEQAAYAAAPQEPTGGGIPLGHELSAANGGQAQPFLPVVLAGPHKNGVALASAVLGLAGPILQLTLIGILPSLGVALAALVLGILGLRRAAHIDGPYQRRDLAILGIVMGAIPLVIGLLLLITGASVITGLFTGIAGSEFGSY